MEAAVQPIEENLWWVIPGKLAGVRINNYLQTLSKAELREAQITFLQNLAGESIGDHV